MRRVGQVGVNPGTATQMMIDKKKEDREQVVPSSVKTSNSVLLILGLIIACGIFVFLIVIVVVVCIWARQTQGYIIGGKPLCTSSSIIARNEACQLTHHSQHQSKFPEERHRKDEIKGLPKKDDEKLTTLVNLPSPQVKTIAISSQVSCPDLSEGTINPNPYHVIGELKELERSQTAQSQNYGTLSRSHLLSSVDEDGYHIDNLGFDFNEDTVQEEFYPSFNESEYQDIDPLDSNTQGALYKNEASASYQPGPLSSSDIEKESSNQESPLKRQLSKQDSFQGLPPFQSFDKYLTLVRIDSTTSIESCTLEETKKEWESIEEEDEENLNVVEEKD
ncbi:hypothetical protein Hamer_G013135 [Homarus americanus]|uniref:Uncharacterized protein n=1 Tax=Homarus americanus TaxID=6706 RepID=A0A8J5JXW2_HOMAM|nr:hypothetical protein Hamer_G013135 [Homarus americanus]